MTYTYVILAAFGNMVGSLFQIGYGLGVMNSLVYELKIIFEKNPTSELIKSWILGGGLKVDSLI